MAGLRVCRSCRRVMPEGSRSCPFCGPAVGRPVGVAPAVAGPVGPDAGPRPLPLVPMALAMLVIAGVAGYVAYGLGRDMASGAADAISAPTAAAVRPVGTAGPSVSSSAAVVAAVGAEPVSSAAATVAVQPTIQAAAVAESRPIAVATTAAPVGGVIGEAAPAGGTTGGTASTTAATTSNSSVPAPAAANGSTVGTNAPGSNVALPAASGSTSSAAPGGANAASASQAAPQPASSGVAAPSIGSGAPVASAPAAGAAVPGGAQASQAIKLGQPLKLAGTADTLVLLATNSTNQPLTINVRAEIDRAGSVIATATGGLPVLLGGETRVVNLKSDKPLPTGFDSARLFVDSIGDPPPGAGIGPIKLDAPKLTRSSPPTAEVVATNTSAQPHSFTVQAAFAQGDRLVGLVSAPVGQLPAGQSHTVALASTAGTADTVYAVVDSVRD